MKLWISFELGILIRSALGGSKRPVVTDGSLTARFARGAFAIPQITVTAVLLALCRAIRPAALARGSTTAEERAVARPGHIGTTAAVIASDRRERAIHISCDWLIRLYQREIKSGRLLTSRSACFTGFLIDFREVYTRCGACLPCTE